MEVTKVWCSRSNRWTIPMLRNRLVVLAGAVALQASAPSATDAQQILLRYRPTPGASMQTVSTTDVT